MRVGRDIEERDRRELRWLGLALAVGLSLYAVVLAALGQMPEVVREHTAWISVPMQVAGMAVGIGLMRGSGRGAEAFGFRWGRWKRDVWESMVMTVPWVVGCVAIKWVGTVRWPEVAGEEIWSVQEVIQWHGWTGTMAYAALYLAMIGAQKVVIHGVIQSTLRRGVGGSQGRWVAILGSAAVFSVLHLHVSLWFALMTVPIGVFWGWMYERQRSLVGVTVSHGLVGAAVFFVVGLGWI